LQNALCQSADKDKHLLECAGMPQNSGTAIAAPFVHASDKKTALEFRAKYRALSTRSEPALSG
jgi:hypothetical protein